MDLRFEQAQKDYDDLKRRFKLPPRYLYNEVSLAQLQLERKNQTHAIFKGKCVHTETVLHYDDSNVSHGLGDLVKTERRIIIRDGRGVIYRKELKSYAGNFVINALADCFGKFSKPRIESDQKNMQLNPLFDVEHTECMDGFAIFERTLDGAHWDWCVLKDDITFHGPSEKACIEGWQKKHDAKIAGSVKAINLQTCLDLISLSFFIFLAWYGMGMADAGLGQYATIFGITMVVPFAAVPVSSALTAFQIFAAMLRSSEPSGSSMAQTQ